LNANQPSQVTNVLTLKPEDNRRLTSLCGQFDEHLQAIAERLGVTIKQRGFVFALNGEAAAVNKTYAVLEELYDLTKTCEILTAAQIHLALQAIAQSQAPTFQHKKTQTIRIKRNLITARGENQLHYINNINKHDINFGIGPAGTGKTYLAVASAVHALETERVSRIILVRPIVEAGEKLGFLPGDLAEKVHPYLRPLYDALYEMLGMDNVTRLIAKDIIELVPLAYMRGRSLNDSFIILDEGQNTTTEQMKMLLTRIGFNSKAVITGDITQIDLANRRDSGLIQAMDILNTHFQAIDVVRHPLVQSIVEAYERYAKK
jgi:phosphate starvation-inducible PhoH-like protein